MKRSELLGLAVLLVFFHQADDLASQPNLPPLKQPTPAKGIHVILQARIYEVEDAVYQKLAKAKRASKDDLEALEREALKAAPGTPVGVESLFNLLDQQKPLVAGKELRFDLGKEGVLLNGTKQVQFLPAPEQLGQGRGEPQTIHEGVVLQAQANISADRRFVRLKIVEQGVAVEGTEKINVAAPEQKADEVGEMVFVKESKISQVRDIPDGGSVLLPLHYRPSAARNQGRWWIARIVGRIYIEEEEKLLRGNGGR